MSLAQRSRAQEGRSQGIAEDGITERNSHPIAESMNTVRWGLWVFRVPQWWALKERRAPATVTRDFGTSRRNGKTTDGSATKRVEGVSLTAFLA